MEPDARLARIETQQIELIQGQARVESGLEGIGRRFDEFRTHFLGNGQKGACAEEKDKVEELQVWKTATSAQLRLLKLLVGAISVPVVLNALNAVKQLLASSGHH